MASKAELLAKALLNDPGSILPKSAMKHVNRAQEEINKALEEISKFADPDFLKRNPEAFRKLSAAIGPAASSTGDVQKHLSEQLYKGLRSVDRAKARPVRQLERGLRRRRVDVEMVNANRAEIMGKIRDMIRTGDFAVGGGGAVAAVPAAVAAGAAVVAAAVEVVTLVRSVTSSSFVDRLVNEARINPRVLDLQHHALQKPVRGRARRGGGFR